MTKKKPAEDLLGKFESQPKKKIYRQKTEEEMSGDPVIDIEVYKNYETLAKKESSLKKGGKELDENEALQKQCLYDNHHRAVNRGRVYNEYEKTAKKYYNKEGEHTSTKLWTKEPRDFIKRKKHAEYLATRSMEVDRAHSDVGEGVVKIYQKDGTGRKRHVATRLRTKPVGHPGVPINMQFRKQRTTKVSKNGKSNPWKMIKKPVVGKARIKKPVTRKRKI